MAGDRSRSLRRGQTVWRHVLDGVMVSTIHENQTFWLDYVGSLIWQLLETPRTDAELAAELAQLFDASEAEIGGDVAEVLDQLIGDGLVDVA